MPNSSPIKFECTPISPSEEKLGEGPSSHHAPPPIELSLLEACTSWQANWRALSYRQLIHWTTLDRLIACTIEEVEEQHQSDQALVRKSGFLGLEHLRVEKKED